MAKVAKHAISIPRSGIRDVFDRVEQIPDAISLCLGEPGETASSHIVEAACNSLREGKTKYTDVLGIPEFREAAANYTNRVKGLNYNADTEIQAVDGATIGLYLAIKSVIDPGDEVIIPSPYFTSYDAEVLMCEGIPVTVALKPEHGMHINAEEIRKAISPRTKAIIINSPCNPTGAVTTAEELKKNCKIMPRI
ncbi:aspartate/tyrosine/aromatic aminotransferase [Gardnerella vaginalis AMD]|nr:aspartate/tyrosine/aromatic aminotransferase [Gardnerella vaginalis AMD]